MRSMEATDGSRHHFGGPLFNHQAHATELGCKLGAEVPVRLGDVNVTRDWSFAKMAVRRE